MAYDQPFKDIFSVGQDRHMTTKDVVSKMVCSTGSRDCYMGTCGQCKDFAVALREKVTNVFNDLSTLSPPSPHFIVLYHATFVTRKE